MNWSCGAYIAGQAFSTLADSALLFAMLDLMRISGAPTWQLAALLAVHAIPFVVLAPFVSHFSAMVPRNWLLLLINSIKFFAVVALVSLSPLLCYAGVGMAAVIQSSARYGMVIELVAPTQYVRFHRWVEGTTIVSVIVGVLLGGLLLSDLVGPLLLSIGLPTVFATNSVAAFAVIAALYLGSMLCNLALPRIEPRSTGLRPATDQVREFSRHNARLWGDKLGQIALATTAVFWGVAVNLRYIVSSAPTSVAGYTALQASLLVFALALGTAVGSVYASLRARLDQATAVVPLGIVMGGVLLSISVGTSIAWFLALGLALFGACGGYLVVAMSGLLRHRGSHLMDPSQWIEVQNFNEQACALGLAGLLMGMSRFGVSGPLSIGVSGGLMAVLMWLISRWQARNSVRHRAEIDHLLAIARFEDVGNQ